MEIQPSDQMNHHQLSWGNLSIYSHSTSSTPNIQWMTDKGLLFTQMRDKMSVQLHMW